MTHLHEVDQPEHFLPTSKQEKSCFQNPILPKPPDSVCSHQPCCILKTLKFSSPSTKRRRYTSNMKRLQARFMTPEAPTIKEKSAKGAPQKHYRLNLLTLKFQTYSK